jgi:hypothetical protein
VALGVIRWWARRWWWCAVQLLTPAAAPHRRVRGTQRGEGRGQRASPALASRRAGEREGRAQQLRDLGGEVGGGICGEGEGARGCVAGG